MAAHDQQNQDLPGGAFSINRPLTSMFIASFFILYLELLLIRWISTEVNVFAYIQNSVLVVCFIALGIGCLSCRAKVNLTQSVGALLAFAAVVSLPQSHQLLDNLGKMLTLSPNFMVWDTISAEQFSSPWLLFALGLASMFLVMSIAWIAFVPLGRMLGRLYDSSPPFPAVTCNLLGNVIGIATFFGMGVLHQPPLIWFIPAIAALGVLAYLGWTSYRTVLLSLLLLPLSLFSHYQGALEVAWSPYQKLAIFPADLFKNSTIPESALYRNMVLVNNAGYQVIVDRREGQAPTAPGSQKYGRYDIPTLLHPAPKEVLVVGSGTGNDVAGALRNGAEQITAVEIDPVIIDFGRRYHPERPYDSDKVQVVIDDARSFFTSTEKKFDVVVFGVLDSHTQGAFTNVRLDHYVYTKESLDLVKKLLKPSGIIVLTFNVRKAYIGDRIFRAFGQLFGTTPLTFTIPFSGLGWGGTMFAHGDLSAVNAQLQKLPELRAEIESWQAKEQRTFSGTTEITTDDWPYLYLPHRTIPPLYYLFSVLLVLPFLAFRRIFGTASLTRSHVNPLLWSSGDWWYFLFGFAFMLLQIHNISKVSALVGNTWQVSGLIIISTLGVSLLANLLTARLTRTPDTLLFALLIGCCGVLYFLDLSFLAGMRPSPRAAIAAIICSTPVFFSSLIYFRVFGMSPERNRAFAINLFGALAAGIIQSVTFLSGIRFLVLLTGASYVAAALIHKNVLKTLPISGPGSDDGENFSGESRQANQVSS